MITAPLPEPARLDAMRCLAERAAPCLADRRRKPGIVQSQVSRQMHPVPRTGQGVERLDAALVRCQITQELPPSLGCPLEAARGRRIMVMGFGA